MHDVLNKLLLINSEIQKKSSKTKVIAVTKTFPLNTILPLINHGHIDYGENKVQEALEKWKTIKEDFTQIKLHMIGKLQTNKVKFALPLFDYIHSLDSFKLAQKIHDEQKKIKKQVKIFIQVNIGNENQKSGIDPENLKEFYKKCKDELDLKIIGLMCIPPNNVNTDLYFQKMNELLNNIGLNELSMGMSSDYLKATEFNSTFVRIGSKIFGNRVN
jgi:PLP dependent protein